MPHIDNTKLIENLSFYCKDTNSTASNYRREWRGISFQFNIPTLINDTHYFFVCSHNVTLEITGRKQVGDD